MRKAFLAGAALGALTLTDAPAFAQRVDSAQPYAPSSALSAVRTEPGVQVHLAGRYRFFAGAASQDFDSTANGKLSSVDFMDYARLWPGFDAMAANGLQYGAQLEIRMTNAAEARGNARGNLTYRRMYGYVGTPTMGEIRLGSGQTGAVERMFTGHMMWQSGAGLWDSGGPSQMMPVGNAVAPNSYWYSASTGNNQTKIAYFSPRFAGFDFGLSYAPNNGNFGGDAGCTTVGVNCDRLSEADHNLATARTRNIVEVMARYRGTIGPVGLTVSGGWYGADTIGAMGTAYAYQNISLGVFGAQATVGGLTFGGLMTGGSGNYATPVFSATTGGTVRGRVYSGLMPLLSGTENDDNMFTWQLGVAYKTGPYGIGMAYSQNIFEGSQVVAGNARDQSLGIGASYAVAPGFNLFAEYMYGRRKENGVDLTTGTAGNRNNAGDINIFTIGTAFNW